MDSYSHKYGESTYHFVLITKCRYKILRRRGHKYLCRDILMRVAERHHIGVVSLGIDDNHVDMVATIKPTMSVSKAFQLLKGASSYAMFRAIPNLRLRYSRGHLWGIGGKFRSVGDVDTQTVVEYSERHNQTRLTHFI